MKNPRISSILTILIVTVVLLIPVFGAEMIRTDKKLELNFGAEEETMTGLSGTDSFSCFTYDNYGHVLHGFRSEQDETWYLCITSAQEPETIRLYWTGNVTAVSAGILNAEQNTVTGGFEKSGDSLLLTQADGMVQKVVILQSDLPSVYVDLAGTTLDDIHADKSQKHPNNSVYIMAPESKQNLAVVGTVEIKGRGNSTWTLADKRGYQIKFDKEVSVLGMERAKKWILLANAFDDSMMRSKLVYSLAEKMDMAFVPSFEYVDLWIDGEYLGTYLMGEKVEIEDSRLNLQQPSGALFEHDEGFYMEEEHWFLSKIMHRHYTLKEIKVESESAISSAMTNFHAAVDRFAAYLYATPSKEATLESLSGMIDVDSFAKYYLINEYVLNRESFVSSFYWYMDGPNDVLHLGPVWDYDTSMGNDGCDYTQRFGENHLLFSYLLSIPEFYQRTIELFYQYRPEFEAIIENAQTIKEEIASSAKMNYLRWELLGKPSGKYPDQILSSSFEESVENVQSWLAGRLEHFQVPELASVNTYVSEDCRTMMLRLDDNGHYYTNVNFALWCSDAEEREVIWYPGQCIDGIWQATADLTAFNMAGFYITTAYSDGVTGPVGGGGAQVPHAAAK